jgi:adenylate cyclase
MMSEKALHVLVVDDDMMARMTAVKCLKQQGHSADTAEGGAQALEALRTRDFDLILLDLLMPDVDGVDVLRQLKADAGLRNTPVIMISGTDEAERLEKCIEMGAADHLAKPLDPALLATKISALVGDAT